jgi:hypothetical protein
LDEDREAIEARYSNHLEIGYNVFEFLFAFSQVYDEKQEAPPTPSRIVTSPYYAKHFSLLLQESIRNYEKENGVIPTEK